MPRRAAVVLLALVATVPAAAWAQGALTAQEVHVGSRPAFVRVVVEFDGPGRLHLGEVHLEQPARLFRQGRARLVIRRPGIGADVTSARGHGVRIRLRGRGGRLVIGLRTARHRFKALRERVLSGPDRLVLELWRARPPGAAATVRADGCLSLDAFEEGRRRVRASGRTLRRLFENSLVVEVRNAAGRVVGSRPATAARSRWRRTVPYTVRRAQRGTIEAAVYSAKDGSLECLVQAPVALRP